MNTPTPQELKPRTNKQDTIMAKQSKTCHVLICVSERKTEEKRRYVIGAPSRSYWKLLRSESCLLRGECFLSFVCPIAAMKCFHIVPCWGRCSGDASSFGQGCMDGGRCLCSALCCRRFTKGVLHWCYKELRPMFILSRNRLGTNL